MGQTIQLRRVRTRNGLGDISVPVPTMPNYDVGIVQMPTEAPPPLLPNIRTVSPAVPTSINIPVGPAPAAPASGANLSILQALATPPPAGAAPATASAASSWMDQQWVSGVKNKYLLFAGGGIFLLAGLKQSKGYRRR